MCGRFSVISNNKNLSEHFKLVRSGDLLHSYNVSPSAEIPVVRLEPDGHTLTPMHWGLIPRWAKDFKIKPINAKAETLDIKPFFRTAFKKNRCLIPANGFYEWKRDGNRKQPFYFTLKDREVMAFAGLWDQWEHEGETLLSCTIITTEANPVMKPVHDRMPVILDPDQYDVWLKDGGKTLLQPYTGSMTSCPVSTAVNNPRHDGEELIAPVSI